MSGRSLATLGAFIVMGVALETLTRCELLVDLDRNDAGEETPDGCAICTDLTEGGADSGGEAGLTSASDAGSREGSLAEAGSTDAGGDANPSEGDAESATMDSGG